jgi:hypothetical protein
MTGKVDTLAWQSPDSPEAAGDEAGQALGREPICKCNRKERFTMKTKADPGPAGKGGPSERKMTLKEKAAFHIFEEVVVGVFRGKAIAQSLPAIGGGSL